MNRYVVEGMDRDGICRASGTFIAAEPSDAVSDAQVVMMGHRGICAYAVYRPARLRRRRSLVTVAGGFGGWGTGGTDEDGDGGLAGVREPRRPQPGPGHLSAAADPPV